MSAPTCLLCPSVPATHEVQAVVLAREYRYGYHVVEAAMCPACAYGSSPDRLAAAARFAMLAEREGMPPSDSVHGRPDLTEVLAEDWPKAPPDAKSLYLNRRML
jgi:hypothetical protein